MLVPFGYLSTANASDRSEVLDVTTGWETDFHTNLPNINVDQILVQGFMNSTSPKEKYVLSNFGNIGDAELTARKTIPMKAGYTYKLDLIYAFLFSNGTAYIDFNGERVVSKSGDSSDQVFKKEIAVTQDALYTITIHFKVAMRSTGYFKLGYRMDNNGFEGFKTEAQVTVHYLDEDGNSVSPDDILTGIEGSSYTAEQKDIPGYTFEIVHGEVAGFYTEEPKEISYVYKKNLINQGQVIVHYRDTKGDSLLSDSILTGNLGDAYKTEQKNIPGYMYESVIGEETGQFSEESKEVIYVYKKTSATQGQVIIHYKDEEGESLLPDSKISGDIGESYTTEPKNIADFIIASVDGEETGIFSEEPKEVTYVYKKASINQGQVIVHYVDNVRSKILPDKVLTGMVNENYEISPQLIAGYSFEKVEGSSKGVFSKQSQEVTFVYTKEAYSVDENPSQLVLDSSRVASLPTHSANRFPDTGEKTIYLWGIIGGVFLCIFVGWHLYSEKNIN